jgi:hypothetical protein
MIKRLYEICLENIAAVYNFYDPKDLAELPTTLITDLLKYLTVKDLENFDNYITNDCQIDSNNIWRQHFKVVWNYFYDLANINNEISYKSRYFEQLFTNTRALEIDLSVKINEHLLIHILNLSLHLIEKYDIKKDRIEYNPILECRKITEKEKWNLKWNSYIKRLALAQNLWHVIRDRNDFLDKFLINVNTLILAGYPQAHDITALKFVIKLLTDGNITHLVLKFPHKVLLKTISILLRNAGKNDVNLTTDDIKFLNNGSISMRNEIIKYGNRSLLWKTLSRRNNGRNNIPPLNRINCNNHLNTGFRWNPRARTNFDNSLHNLNHNEHEASNQTEIQNLNRFNRTNSVQYCNDETNVDQSSYNFSQTHFSEPQNNNNNNTVKQNELSIQRSTSSTDQTTDSLFTIDEDPVQTNDRLIYSVPKNSKLCFLNSLDIYSMPHKSNIELLSHSLLEMDFLENLSISYINSYSQELEDSLLKLTFRDKLKSLSLNSIRLSYGTAGFMYQLLMDHNDNETVVNEAVIKEFKPIMLTMLKLELIKSQNPEFSTIFRFKPCRKMFVKKLIWKETEFSQAQMKVLQIFLQNSEILESLDLRAIRFSSYLAPCLSEIIKSCQYLRELRIKQFLLNQLNEFEKLVVLLEKNQLKVLHIESCEIFEHHIESDNFEIALSLASNLHTLNLPKNSLRDELIVKFCESIRKMCDSSICLLKSIDLSENRLTSEGIRILCETLRELNVSRKCCVKYIKLNGNRCTTETLMELKNYYKDLMISF